LSSGSSGGSGDCWYDRPRSMQPSAPIIPPKSPKHAAAAPPPPTNGRCHCCPPDRPPKPHSPRKALPPVPRPAPGHAQPVAPMDNYDVPRSILHGKMPVSNTRYILLIIQLNIRGKSSLFLLQKRSQSYSKLFT